MGIYMGMHLNTDTLNITREIPSLIDELGKSLHYNPIPMNKIRTSRSWMCGLHRVCASVAWP